MLKIHNARFFKYTFFITLVVMAIVNTIDFPLSVPYFQRITGGQKILDMQFGYGMESINRLFSSLGAEGRDQYFKMFWTLDLILPVLFGLTLLSGNLVAWKKKNFTFYISMSAPLVDFAENIVISLMLCEFESGGFSALAAIASLLTRLKHSLYGLSIVLMFLGYMKSKKANATQ